MPFLQCYVDDRTERTLKAFAEQSGRTVEDLAEAAVSEAALRAERDMRPKPTLNHCVACDRDTPRDFCPRCGAPF